MNREKGKRIVSKIVFFLKAVFWILIFSAPLLWMRYMWEGYKYELKDLSEDEVQLLEETYKAVYNLELGDTDEIVSITYMARGVDPFFVLKIKTSSPDDFCANNAEALPRQEELVTIPFLFSSRSYVPLKGKATVYYSKDYVYVSSWAHKSPEVSDVYYEIKDNR